MAPESGQRDRVGTCRCLLVTDSTFLLIPCTYPSSDREMREKHMGKSSWVWIVGIVEESGGSATGGAVGDAGDASGFSPSSSSSGGGEGLSVDVVLSAAAARAVGVGSRREEFDRAEMFHLSFADRHSSRVWVLLKQ